MSKSTERTAPKRLRIVIPTIILLIWLVLGSVGGPYFGKISDVATNDQTTFLPASAESTQVSGELEKFQDEKSIPTILVFTDGDKILPDDTITKIKDETAKLSSRAEVVGEVSPPITSDDGKAALVVVNVSSNVKYDEFVPELRSTLDAASLPAQFKVTGPVGFLYDLAGAFAGIDGILLGVALAVVFIILLIVYRSPVLPFVVLLNSIFALSAAILVVYYLAKADLVTLNGQVQGILFILVIGAATDYALLYTARYREELTRHTHAYQAILASWRRSLEPILAAGGTVTAGLLCLLLSDLNSNKALGPVGAVGIILAIVSALTLLPSLLLMWGRKVFWPRMPKYRAQATLDIPKTGLWPRIAGFVGAHARSVWIVTTLILVVCSAGVTKLQADGVAQSDLILGVSEARDGQQLIDRHFPGGSGTPAQIIIPASQLDAAAAIVEADTGVASVSVRANNSDSGTKPLGRAEADIKEEIRTKAEQELTTQKADLRAQIEAQSPGMPSSVVDQIYDQAVANIPTADDIVADAYPFKDAAPKVVNGEVLLEATLEDNADSDAAQATVQRLRTSMHQLDSDARVGGTTATQLDTRTSAEHDRAVVLPTVLVVITIILMLLLRSVLAPILLLLTTILSFTATLGVSALLFNNVWHFPGADPSVVLYGFIFLVALGIDYNIFLMTRVREESLRIGTRRGVLAGLIVTGGVITSAGIVLAATFAALAVIPILFLAQLAFIVAFGVLLDTIIVRSLLVPALVHDIGNRVWWPSRKFKK
ncbi:MMPL family transporter [Candidatus Mycosynbacter amalyticus]|nr:efflux RND transporter permease subunit [Candidatus Mycosynbacter amalyticus]